MFLASGSPVSHVLIGREGDNDTGMRWREGGGRGGSHAATGCEVLAATRTWEVEKRLTLQPYGGALIFHDLFPEPEKTKSAV